MRKEEELALIRLEDDEALVTSIEGKNCNSCCCQLSMRPTREVAKGSGEGGGRLDEALSRTGPSN